MRFIRRIWCLAVLVLFVVSGISVNAHADNQPETTALPKVAVFDFDFYDTSHDPDSPEQEARVKMLDTQLRDTLTQSGQFTVVNIDPVRADLSSQPDIRNCNGCEVDAAAKLGADYAISGVVQKVSNLILNINLYVKEVPSGKLHQVISVDIRGNTDKSWSHGLSYLLRHYVLDHYNAGVAAQ